MRCRGEEVQAFIARPGRGHAFGAWMVRISWRFGGPGLVLLFFSKSGSVPTRRPMHILRSRTAETSRCLGAAHSRHTGEEEQLEGKATVASAANTLPRRRARGMVVRRE